MFLGHYAVGFASRKLASRTSLGVLIAAAILLDLLWPVFLLFGWERVRIDPGNTRFTPLDFISYPYSHSLLMVIGWSILFGGIYWLFRKRTKAALIIGFAVFSHWVLDVLTHRPDMPLSPWSSAKVGLGLWNHPAATVIVELAMFTAGVWIYARATAARDRIGLVSFWTFVIFLPAVYAINLFSAPPPNTTALAYVTLLTWLFPFWSAWFDRHRRADV